MQNSIFTGATPKPDLLVVTKGLTLTSTNAEKELCITMKG